jgi:hypothetical protein
VAELATIERHGAAALAVEFSWRIDHQAGNGVSALFTSDGVYGYTGFEMHGTAAIDAFYRERRERGKRLSRHLFSPARYARAEDGSISAWSTLTLYAADGEPPYPATVSAIMDYHDRIVCIDSTYRFARRWVTPLFGHMPQLVAAQKTGEK